MRPRETAALLLLSLVWGAAFLFNGEVVGSVPPLTVVAGRLSIAACLLVPVALLRQRSIPQPGIWPVLVFMALFNNVIPFTLITAAQEHISSSLAATLVGTMPLFTLVFAIALGTERPGAEKVAGLVIGFLGAVVVIGPSLGDFTDSNTVAQLAVIAASACYAIATVVARKYARGDPLGMAAGQMVVGAVAALPLAFAIDGAPSFDIPLKAAFAWLALGLLSTGLAYIIFYALVQRLAATQVSMVSYLIPIVATVLGWLVLSETIGISLFVGLVLILIGVVAANGSLRSMIGAMWSRVRSGGSMRGGSSG